MIRNLAINLVSYFQLRPPIFARPLTLISQEVPEGHLLGFLFGRYTHNQP